MLVQATLRITSSTDRNHLCPLLLFRDPAERLLSAYIDKFVRNNKYSLIIFKEKHRVLR